MISRGVSVYVAKNISCSPQLHMHFCSIFSSPPLRGKHIATTPVAHCVPPTHAFSLLYFVAVERLTVRLMVRRKIYLRQLSDWCSYAEFVQSIRGRFEDMINYWFIPASLYYHAMSCHSVELQGRLFLRFTLLRTRLGHPTKYISRNKACMGHLRFDCIIQCNYNVMHACICQACTSLFI